MKKLFIYYSHSGNGELVMKYFHEKDYEIIKIIPKKKLPKSFFLKMMVLGFLAGLHHKAKIIDFKLDISLYDEVIIEAPIWNGAIACPINTVLSKLNLENKKLTFILCSGGGNSPKAHKCINKKYKDAKIIELQEPKKYKENLEKLEILNNGN